jgi:hypothetical protein
MANAFSQGYMRGNGDPNLDLQIQGGGAKIPKLYIDDLTDSIYNFDDSFPIGEKWVLLFSGFATIQTDIKCILQGPAPTVTIMPNTLATSELIPLNEPYESLGYSRANFKGETVANVDVFKDNNIVDWILVELRDSKNPEQLRYNRAGLLRNDGQIMDVDGVTPLTFTLIRNEEYYVAIKHRNHFGIMTNDAYMLNTPLDFTDTNLPIWGVPIYELVANGLRRLRRGKSSATGFNRLHGILGYLVYLRQETSPSKLNVYSIYDYNLNGTLNVADYSIGSLANNFISGLGLFGFTEEQIPDLQKTLIRDILNYNNNLGVLLSNGTTSERLLNPPTNGYIRYNTDDNKMEYFNGTTWIQW